MLYVEKDLSAVAKAVFDQWDLMKHELNHKVLYCANARVSAADIINCIEQGMHLIPAHSASKWLRKNSYGQEMYL